MAGIQVAGVTAAQVASSSVSRSDAFHGTGLVPVANYSGTIGGAGTASMGSDTLRSWKCMPFYLTVACSYIVLEFQNWYSGGNPDTDGPVSGTLRVGVEVGRTLDSGAILPVKFGGADTVTVAPGGTVRSDPIYLDGQVGDKFWPRVTWTPASGASYVYTGTADSAFGYAFSPVQDNSRANTNWAGGANQAMVPSRILGKPNAGATVAKSVALVGDSIMQGANSQTDQFRGGFALAIAAQGLGFVKIARGGEDAGNFSALAASSRRLALIAGCTHAVEEYGTNDFNANRSHATVAASRLVAWQRLTRMGMKVYATTTTPRTTSTDNWLTAANQTGVNAAFQPGGAREQHNTWLRDGAPMIGTTVQATGASGGTVARCAVYGSTGALVTAASGPSGHPLAGGVIDVAAAVESSLNSSKWKVNGRGTTVTDAAITSGSALLSSTSAAFVSGDVGSSVYVIGAGAASGNLSTTISSVSGGVATLATTAGTTVSGATASLGIQVSNDGTHPVDTGHTLIQAAIPTL